MARNHDDRLPFLTSGPEHSIPHWPVSLIGFDSQQTKGIVALAENRGGRTAC
jgi:hypothetical protein